MIFSQLKPESYFFIIFLFFLWIILKLFYYFLLILENLNLNKFFEFFYFFYFFYFIYSFFYFGTILLSFICFYGTFLIIWEILCSIFDLFISIFFVVFLKNKLHNVEIILTKTDKINPLMNVASIIRQIFLYS